MLAGATGKATVSALSREDLRGLTEATARIAGVKFIAE